MKLKPLLKWTGASLLGLVALVAVVVIVQVVSFNRSLARTYDVPPLELAAVSDSLVVARGMHLAEALGGCVACHGADLGGRVVEDLGPIGRIVSPNLTKGKGGVGSIYSDGEIARAVKYGIDSDGRTLRFMPSEEHHWWPESDLVAIVSYLRSVRPVDRESEPTSIGTLGKVLNQFGVMELRSAVAVETTEHAGEPPSPEPTARYGSFLAIGCKGCHGDEFSGGRIPGAPANLPIPANLTPHETGLAAWSRADFDTLLDTSLRPDGRELDPFMPIQTLRAMNETERAALWEYLQSLEPREFGGR